MFASRGRVASLFLLTVATLAPRASAAAPVAPEHLPPVNVSWEDREQRDVFVVRGDRYELRVATAPARIASLKIDGVDVLGRGGMELAFDDEAGRRLAPAPRDLTPDWQVWRGQGLKPAADARARMNVWSATPYYADVHLSDIPFLTLEAADALRKGEGEAGAPLRGELVIHAHPDRVHLELRATPTPQQAKPARAVMRVALPARAMKVGDRAVATWGNGAAAAALLAPAGGRFDVGQVTTIDAPTIGNTSGATWVLRPASADADLSALFAPELKPISAPRLRTNNGRWLGYDAASGLYVAEMARELGAYGFDAAHRVPNRRMELPVEIENDAPVARPITVRVRTGAPTLPGAVVADAHGFPTGVTAFVSKNFAGEREEPDDGGYGDVYFPLTLAPGETRALTVIGLFERWGDHLVKQVSSVRFFNVYWHLSTGLSESTCFTHAWMRLNDTYVQVPDFRPRSGDYWLGQPQHDCDTWPGFLQYKSAGQDVRLMYEGTRFRSIAPNLADFTMKFRTSDDAGVASVRVIEVPQADEMRTFVNVRYDWTKPAKIDADARANFRWLNVNEKTRPARVLWLDEQARPQLTDVMSGEPTLLGQVLAKDGAFVGATGKANGYDSLVLVRSFKAKLGGKAYDAPHVSAAFGEKVGDYWLAAPAQALELRPGDFLEAELMLMPHAAPAPPLAKPTAERARWFVKGPAVGAVTIGTKASDFPARVDAEAGAARFAIGGGHDALTVTVGNVRGEGTRPPVPLLWRDDVWVDPQAHGGDGWQTDFDGEAGDENATYRFTFVVPQRNGQTQQLTVTRVTASEPIARLADVNGRPTITAEREADFDLAAPILFGPGVNRVYAGQPLASFKGRATAVSGLPIRAAVTTGEATVTVGAFGTDRVSLTTAGDPLTLTIGELSAAVAYELKVNGAVTTPTVRDHAIEVKLEAGEASVELRRSDAPAD